MRTGTPHARVPSHDLAAKDDHACSDTWISHQRWRGDCHLPTQIIHQPTDQASLWIRPDGTILLACSTFEDWFGYGAKELQSMTIYNLVMDRAAQLRE
jgi:hypothetical protein